MPVLTDEQLQNGYFAELAGFPPAKIIHTVAEYDGATCCCIACTQLADDESDQVHRQILADWIRFFQANPVAFRAVHLASYVPQKLFDAVCCQKNLIELRCKWGKYTDLLALTNLHDLQYLYLGSCPGVKDITPITRLEQLVVLYVENFKQIEDYSPLTALTHLEQLVISGSLYSSTPLRDLDFIRDMPSLASFGRLCTTLRKKYTKEEKEQLHTLSPDVLGINDQAWWY